MTIHNLVASGTVPDFHTGFTELDDTNPVGRSYSKMDNWLRGMHGAMTQNEVVAVLNSLNASYQKQSKFSDKYGLAVARHVVRAAFGGYFPSRGVANQAQLEPGSEGPLGSTEPCGLGASDLRGEAQVHARACCA